MSRPAPAVRVQRVVVHSGGDPRTAQRLAQSLPDALREALALRDATSERALRQLVADAAREARR